MRLYLSHASFVWNIFTISYILNIFNVCLYVSGLCVGKLKHHSYASCFSSSKLNKESTFLLNLNIYIYFLNLGF